MTDEDKLNLIFLDALSTKEETTDISGRGVGMPAVKAVVDKLNGKIEIKSNLGEGTNLHH